MSSFNTKDIVGHKVMQILIVEDEALVSWSLANALRSDGNEVTVVEMAETAIEVLRSHQFDLVITDSKLPVIDGFQVAATAKALSSSVPVIMMSAVEDQDSREKVERIHIDRFVEKPFDLKEMVHLAYELASKSGEGMISSNHR